MKSLTEHYLEIVMQFLCSGKLHSEQEESTGLELIDIRLIDEISSFIKAELSFDLFKVDSSMDFCSQYRNFNFVSSKFFDAKTLTRYLGSSVNTSAMVAQSFNMWAAVNGSFTLHLAGDIAISSRYSWPCIIGNYNASLITFAGITGASSAYFLLCDPYWCHPYAIIDFNRRSGYFLGAKEEDGLKLSRILSGLIPNIVAWCICSRFPNKASKDSIEKPLRYIYVGGAPNPAHILWNYLGGIDLAYRALGRHQFDSIVLSTDILFQTDWLKSEVVNLSRLQELDRIKMLCALGYSSGLCLKFSDAGINPSMCARIYRHYAHKQVVSSSASQDPMTNLDSKDAGSSVTNDRLREITIVITIRAIRRVIRNQVELFPALISSLSKFYSGIRVIFEGSARGAWSRIPQEEEVVSQIKYKLAQLACGADCILESVIGLQIEEQIKCAREADSFISYVSGGSFKLISFTDIMGVCVGPDCQSMRTSAISLDEAHKSTALCEYLSLIAFKKSQLFYQDSTVGKGYLSSITPPLLLLGQAYHKGIARDFDADLVVELDLLCDLVKRSVHYNQLKRSI